MIYTNGKIIIHQHNNAQDLLDAATKIMDYLSEDCGIEAEFIETEEFGFPAFHVPEGVTYQHMNSVLDYEIAFKAINEDVIYLPEPSDVVVTHNFTPKEREEIAESLTDFIEEKEKVSQEAKEIAKEYKKKVDKLDAMILDKSRLHRQGYEDKNYSCYIKYNFADRKKYYIDVETESVLKTDNIGREGLQLRVDHIKEAKVKPLHPDRETEEVRSPLPAEDFDNEAII